MRKRILINCKYCNKICEVNSRGKSTPKFCSKSCSSKFNMSLPEVKEKIGNAVSKPYVDKICEWCKKKYSIPSKGKDSKNRRFCCNSCAAKWRMSFQERRETSRKQGKRMSQMNIGKKRPDASKRMKENNPMKNPENIEKMRKKKIGCTFLSRGGNPKKTIPQILLAEKLNLIENMEYVINTTFVKDKFKSLPNCYKVDIAIPNHKIVIEVDGNTHKLKKWKQIDKRKTEVLQALGWSVLRFTNEEILNDLEKVLNVIKKYKEEKL